MKKESTIITSLRERLLELGFRLVSVEEKKREFERLGKEFPDRVTGLHHYQDMYIFEHLGYRAVVNTGIINGKLMKPGLSWVLITEDSKTLFARAFKENSGNMPEIMSDRLVAYAQLVQNIVLNRPLDPVSKKPKDLVEHKVAIFIKETGKYTDILKNSWFCDHGPEEDLFSLDNMRVYFDGIDEYSSNLIHQKEKIMYRYFTLWRKAKNFRKEIRKKSLTKKPENSYVK